jgi:thiosulfate/3-mercaptopyruvate sulfurtransferase
VKQNIVVKVVQCALGFLALVLMSFANRCAAADDAAENRTGEILKQPFDVKLQLGDSELAILDVREKKTYQQEHIPGARHVDVAAWRDKSLSPGGLHDAEFWSDAVGKLGIDNTTRAVVYGDNLTDAARVWWTLKYLGLHHVALLDGGWQAWVDEDYPVEAVEPQFETAKFRPQFQAARLIELEDLLKSVEADSVKVIDARSNEEFRGESATARSGHIPGAVHLEWKDLLDEKGRFKNREELAELVAQRGISGDATVVTHCQTGGRASVDAFVFELLGYPNVKNYYCGWQQWSADEKAPIEKAEKAQTPPR